MTARGVTVGSLMALALLAAPAARAQQGDAREVEAKKACLGGHPDRGIELLADLYAETSDPTYIYNQGRCFEQNGRNADAVVRFREYLRKATNLAADERAQVQARIDVLDAAAHPAGPAPVQPIQPTLAAPAPAPVLVSGPDAPEATSRARHLRIGALAAAAVGVAAVAAGVIEGLRAHSLAQEVTSDANRGVYSQSKFDSGTRAQTLEVIGFSVGGAALVAAGVLYGLSRSHDEAPPVTAMIDRTGAGALWRVTF